MFPDYYKILGVKPSDSFDTIKSAFRKKAMECHPDRGGSVEAMKVINEAWEILSNPEMRRIYDAARTNPNNPETVRTANDNAQYARQRSEDFPRRWTDFEQLLNKVTEDFQNAKHGQETVGGFVIPTVENSISGVVFIIAGAVIGGCVLGLPTYSWLDGTRFSNIKVAVFPLPVCAAGLWAFIGAWLGARLHQGIGSSLKVTTPNGTNSTNAEPQSTDYRVFSCNKCQQKLRVPQLNAKLTVTCSKCGDKFDV